MSETWRNLTACENEYIRLSEEEPAALVEWIDSGLLDSVGLTLAAEALGRSPAHVAVPCLLRLLKHPKSLVREGAIYGISAFESVPGVRAEIFYIACHDASKTIRDIAAQAVE